MAEIEAVPDLFSRIPETAAGFSDVIESLPEVMRTQASWLADLAEALSGLAGPSAQQTVSALHEVSGYLSVATDAAEGAALEFGEESRFWLSD